MKVRYKPLRYLKLLLNVQIILLICISALFSNSYMMYLNYKYNKFYNNAPQTITAKAVVVEEAQEEYYYTYTIKIKEGIYKNKKFYLNIKNNKLEYGDLIELEGEYLIPSETRNYKGFDYREYLKTKKIYGTIKAYNIKIIEKNSLNYFFIVSNKIRNYIKNKCDELLPQESSKLLNGILLGDKSEISEDIIENFKLSNLSHFLAVSGAHTAYIILGITYILNRSKISKRWIYVATIFSLIIYIFITNFAISVTRACLMSILVLMANLFYRKADVATNVSLSLLITLIINPFSINEIGLQLSYLGTIGIILFFKNIESIFNRFKINKSISKLISIPISAQCMIMPIMSLKFNRISLTFIISNILASPLLGINIILGFITILVSIISTEFARLFTIPLNLSLKILIFIAEVTAKIPLSSILIKTPHLITVIFVYIIILISNYLYSIYQSKENLKLFQKRILALVNYKNLKKVLLIIIIIIILFNLFSHLYLLIFQTLKIYFIDVGQGDSCLIITPNNKKILIDGGEGSSDVLLSYLLDRRIKAIDYIMISHFDSDHCNGLIEVIENLNVKNIIISKQAYFSEEYINIANIINSKKINVIHVKQGDSFNICKDVSLFILYPPEELEYSDLNNNSIVTKLTYNSFSMLFTGDIEDSETNILNDYDENNLRSTVIKVAHHGSKTSSNEQFLKAVNPKIALIGVGENNTFGHPNSEVLQRLNDINCKIYRTDQMGEIEIKVSRKGKIWINKMLD